VPPWLERLEDRTVLDAPPLLTGNTLATAATVALAPGASATVGGLVGSATDQKLYAVNLAANSALSASLAPASSGNALSGGVVEVFDSQGNQLAASDAFSGGTPSVQFVTAAAGKFYVGVTGTGNDLYDPHQGDSGTPSAATTTGAFQLSLKESALPGDHQTQAGAITVHVAGGASPVVGDALGADGTNYYSVQLGQDQVLDVQVTAPAANVGNSGSGNSFSGTVSILDQGGNVLATGFGESTVYQVAAAGPYFVSIASQGGSGAGAYEVQLAVAPPPPSGTPDTENAAAGVTLSAAGTASASGVVGATDEQLYAVNLDPGSALSLDLAGTGGSPLTGGVVQVFDDSGNQLLASDFATSAGGATPPVQFVTDAGGQFFVGVSGSGNDAYDPTQPGVFNTNGTTGAYQLSFQTSALPGTDHQSQADAAPLAVAAGASAVVGDFLADPNAGNFYSLHLDPGQILTLTAQVPSFNFTQQLSVLDQAGDVLAGSSGSNSTPTATFDPASAGTYFVEVSAQSGSTFIPPPGAYEVQLSVTPPGTHDTLTSATLVSLPAAGTASASGVVGATDEELYSVNLAAGSDLSLGLAGAGSSPLAAGVLQVFDDSGNQLLASDFANPAGGATPPVQFFTATAGQFFVGVSGSGNDKYDPTQPGTANPNGTTGAYQLTFQEAAADSPLTLAVPAGASVVVGDSLADSGAGNFYSVQLDQGQVLSLSANVSSFNFTPQLSVLDAAGNVLVSSPLFGPSQALTFDAITAGTYSVEVSAQSGSTPPLGAYEVQLAVAPPSVGPNDNMAAAAPVTLSSGGAASVKATVGATDEQLYVVNVAANSALSLDLKGAGDNPLTAGVLQVFDSGGNQLLASDFANPQGAATPPVQILTTTGGQFFVGVSGAGNDFYNPRKPGTASNGTTGFYQLSFQDSALSPSVHQSQADAVALAVAGGGSAVVGDSLADAGAGNFYSVQLGRGQVLSLSANVPSFNFIPQLSILDTAGHTLVSNAVSDPTQAVKYNATKAGTYYVEVSAQSGSTFIPPPGGYEVQVAVALPVPLSKINDTLASATAVSLSAAGTGSAPGVVGATNEQVYAVNLKANSALSLSLAGVGNNLLTGGVLRVFDSGGNPVAANDLLLNGDTSGVSTGGNATRGGPTVSVEQAVQLLSAAGGLYYVGVSGAGNDQYDPTQPGTANANGTTGSYQLSLKETPVAADYQTLATAPTVGVTAGTPVVVADALADPNAVHLYKVQLTAGQQLAVNVVSTGNGQAAFLSYLRIFNAGGQEVAFNDAVNSQNEPDTAQRFYAATTGTYYVGVSAYDNNSYDVTQAGSGGGGFSTGAYEMRLAVLPGDFNTNDTLAGAPPVDFHPYHTTTLPGAIHNADDVALYAIHLGAGDTVSLSALSLSPGDTEAGSQLTPYLRLLDGRSNDLANSGFVADFGTAGLQYTAAAAGTYYVGVSSWGNTAYDPTQPPSGALADGGSVGAFKLQVEVETTLPRGVAALALNGRLNATVNAGTTQVYGIQVRQPGQLTLTAASGSGLAPQLALSNIDHQLLIDSTGAASGSPAATLVQHLNPGIYYVAVSAAPGGAPAGAFTLATAFTLSSAPYTGDAVPTSYSSPVAVVGGNGRTDLAVLDGQGDVVILPGLGDGTFGAPLTISGMSTAADGSTIDTQFSGPLAVGDFGPGGTQDLAVAGFTDDNATGYVGNSVTILTPRPDGTFAAGPYIPLPYAPTALTAGDFSSTAGTGPPEDFAVAGTNAGGAGVTLLLHQPGGAFKTVNVPLPHTSAFPYQGTPESLAAGTFANDGHTDLAVGLANPDGTPAVAFLDGQGGGKFTPGTVVPLTTLPKLFPPPAVSSFSSSSGSFFSSSSSSGAALALSAGKAQGGGMYVAATEVALFPFFDAPSPLVVLNANGKGGFTSTSTDLGFTPVGLATSDLGGDGNSDVVTADAHGVFVLQDLGGGTFQAPARYGTFDTLTGLAVGDFSGDGRPGVAVLDSGAIPNQPAASAQSFTSSLGFGVYVLAGKGDGTLQEPQATAVGNYPRDVAVGDFNGDGHLDVVTADNLDGTLSVLLGNGDGTFGQGQTIQLGASTYPTAVAVADVNGDGIPDLAVTESGTNAVEVLLGTGDGTFQQTTPIPVDQGADYPFGITAADLTGDGSNDLVVTNVVSGTVTVLLNKGDGTFQTPRTFGVGSQPVAVVAGNFTGHGHVDLAVANYASNTISVLAGDGQGNFQLASTLAVGVNPYALAAGDFGNGHTDLVTANSGSGDLSVLLNGGNGTFQPAHAYAAGSVPAGLLVGDFNGDGKQDVAAVNYFPGEVYVLDGNGNGTFQDAQPLGIFGPADQFSAVAAGDFTGNGRTDLALANVGLNSATVLLGNGDGTFSPPGAFSNQFRVRPILADLNGDGIPDAVTVTQNGDILFRAGRGVPPGPGQVEQFAAPVVLNPGNPANDVALVTDTGPGGQAVNRLAALDRTGNAITFYSFNAAGGGFTATPGPAVQPGAVHIASADLNGDGRGDLVVSNGAAGTVSVLTANADGSFSTYTTPPLGNGPSDITLADVSGGRYPDVVVTNQLSGDVSVLLNTPTDPFTQEYRYRAGTGPYGTVNGSSSVALQSLDQPAVAVGGNFTGGPTPDLLVTDSGSDTFSLLRAAGGGTFFNPQSSLPLGTGSDPTAAVAGPFATNSPLTDVAVLNQASDTISVYLGDGHGNFTAGQILPAGNDPTSLALAYLGGPSAPADLVVTNEYGDLLVLPGNGDGTFQDYLRADQYTSLALAGPNQLIYSDYTHDKLTAGTPQGVLDSSTNSLNEGRNSTTAIQAPGPVQAVTFPDGSVEVLVANSGANEVLLYHTTPQKDGALSVQGPPQVIPVGTDPVGLTIYYPNGPTAPPDVLVADEGSNDVIVLGGSGTGLGWSLAETQRLQVGAGPVSTTIVTQTNGTTELLVTDSQGNEVQGLPGRGPGHFSDLPGDVQVWQTPPGSDPQQAFVGNFDAGSGQDLAILNAGSSNLTVYSNYADNHGQMQSVSSGGTDPVAAVEATLGGYASLVVANNGDGRVALVAGGPNGPQVVEAEAVAGLSHPTGLVLLPPEESTTGTPVGGADLVQVYVAEGGAEAATLLTFNPSETSSAFNASEPGALPVFQGSADTGGQRAQAGELQAITDSGLGLIATLETGGGQAASAGPAGEGATSVAGASSAFTGTLASAVVSSSLGVGGDDTAPEGDNAGAGGRDNDALKRFLLDDSGTPIPPRPPANPPEGGEAPFTPPGEAPAAVSFGYGGPAVPPAPAALPAEGSGDDADVLGPLAVIVRGPWAETAVSRTDVSATVPGPDPTAAREGRVAPAEPRVWLFPDPAGTGGPEAPGSALAPLDRLFAGELAPTDGGSRIGGGERPRDGETSFRAMSLLMVCGLGSAWWAEGPRDACRQCGPGVKGRGLRCDSSGPRRHRR
jgi:hypothetical protein